MVAPAHKHVKGSGSVATDASVVQVRANACEAEHTEVVSRFITTDLAVQSDMWVGVQGGVWSRTLSRLAAFVHNLVALSHDCGTPAKVHCDWYLTFMEQMLAPTHAVQQHVGTSVHARCVALSRARL